MDQAERLLLLADVVEAGSFRKAAERRQVTRSMVSKQIRRLEEEWNTRLLQRTTRTLSLTEIGREVYEQALLLRSRMEEIRALVEEHQQEVRGELRITCAAHFGRWAVQPVALQLLREYPALRIDLQLNDRFVDIVSERFDIGIRIGRPEDSTLISRKLQENPVCLVASPSFVEQWGLPSSLEEIGNYPCVVYASPTVVVEQWSFVVRGETRTLRVPSNFRVNDGVALLDAVLAGGGIGLLPVFLAEECLQRGTLLPVLPSLETVPYAPIYAVYPSRQHLPPKTRVFLDRLKEHLQSSIQVGSKV